jgi:hypothetical protein
VEDSAVEIENGATWWIVGSGASNIEMLNSSMHSSTPGTGLLLLVGKSEALIRNCNGSNVKISEKVGAGARLGIVDSAFEPAVYPSYAVRPPSCGVPMANSSQICDPRAQCVANPSGSGIQCNCTGNGLSNAGALDNGESCTRSTTLETSLSSNHIRLTITKPGNRPLLLKLRAQGQHAFDLAFDVRLARFTAQSSKPIDQAAFRVSFEPNRALASTLPFHGQHIEWNRSSAANETHIELDLALQKFDVARDYSLLVTLNCSNRSDSAECVSDGDIVQTVVRVMSISTGTDVFSEFSITATTESAVSCLNSKAFVEGFGDAESITIRTSTALMVQAEALDVDKLPISYSRAQFSLALNGQPIPFRWDRGSNVYRAAISAALTEQPGEYELVLKATNTSDESTCELLHRAITVTQFDPKTVLFAGAAVAIVCMGIIWLVLRRWRKKLRGLSTLLFGEIGELVVGISMEFAGLASDGTRSPTHRASRPSVRTRMPAHYAKSRHSGPDFGQRNPTYGAWYGVLLLDFGPLRCFASAAIICERVMSGAITIRSHSDIDYRVVYALCMLLGALGALVRPYLCMRPCRVRFCACAQCRCAPGARCTRGVRCTTAVVP